MEVRHHCHAGGGREEADQNVVMEAHETTQVHAYTCRSCDTLWLIYV